MKPPLRLSFGIVVAAFLGLAAQGAFADNQARFAAIAMGDVASLSLTATVFVADADLGAPGAIYLAADTGTGWFVNQGGRWMSWTGGPLTAYATGPLSSRNIPVVANSNVSPLGGTRIVVGYGRDERDLLDKGRYAQVHTLGAPAAVAELNLYGATRPATAAVGAKSQGTLTTADGRQRRYRLYVPASVKAGTAAPLLVALHGGLGSAAQYETNSGFTELAEANSFIVVYPDGVGSLVDERSFQTWNGGDCCGPAQTKNVDDVGFIRGLVETMAATYSVDPSRVFVAGHSNGAIMAYRLACELSDKIAAIGVQAGSLEINTCKPAHPVSVFHLHGTADMNLPIIGGVGSQGVSGVEFRPPLDGVLTLALANRCAAISSNVVDTQNPDLSATTHRNCAGATEVRFVAVNGASHAWMGHDATSAAGASLSGAPYRNLDASRAIWAFLSTHPRQ